MAESLSMEQVLESLKKLVRDAEALVAASAGYTSDGMQETRARAEETLAAAKERLARFQEEVIDRAREAVDVGETYLRDKPWQALAIAAAVGFLAGALLSRRRT